MNIRKQIIAALGAMVLLGSTVAPSLADTTSGSGSSVVITGGVRSVSITGGDFGTQSYNLEDQTRTGSFTVAASDYTGSGDGWNVQIKGSGPFATNPANATSIPLGNLTIKHSSSNATVTGSDPVGPIVESASLSASTSNQTLLTAAAGDGEGAYQFEFGGSTLLVPGQTRAGTYSTTITVEIGGGAP